eukprot:scaffold294755_cov26-Tisochrysis_lutea.AAC.1
MQEQGGRTGGGNSVQIHRVEDPCFSAVFDLSARRGEETVCPGKCGEGRACSVGCLWSWRWAGRARSKRVWPAGSRQWAPPVAAIPAA